MKITRFEDMEAWQAARELVRLVYRLTQGERFRRDFGLISQIQRAAVSTMSNLAEGFDSGSNNEFVRYLGYTRRSASEVQCHLYAALDQGYVMSEQFDDAYRQAETVRKLSSAFARYLRAEATRQLANRLTRKP